MGVNVKFPSVVSVTPPFTGVPIKVVVAPVLFKSFVRTLIVTGVVPQVDAESATATGGVLTVTVTFALLDTYPLVVFVTV